MVWRNLTSAKLRAPEPETSRLPLIAHAANDNIKKFLRDQSGHFTFPVGFWSGAAAPPPSSYIQSIQPFSITIAASNTSNTATITSVNTSNTVIFWGGFTTSETTTSYNKFEPYLTLTNATTVTATRGTSDTGTVTVYGTAVEFISAAMNSAVQYGTITTTGTSGTATISAVGSGAVVFWLGQTITGNATFGNYALARLVLTNSTTVTANRTTGSSIIPLVVSFAVVDFAPSVINSIQARSLTLSNSSSSTTDTISSVSTNDTMLVYNGSTTNSENPAAEFYALQLTSPTQVTLTRSATNTITRIVNYTALEFASGVLDATNGVQRGTLAMTNATSNTAAISSVDTTRSALNCTNFYTSLTSVTPNECYPGVELTDATTVTSHLNTGASGVTSTVGYEIVQFA